MNPEPHSAYLALGSNLGQRRANIEHALAQLAAHPEVQVQAVSRLYETAPVDMADEADWFLNGAARIETTLSPRPLLELCLAIERRLGRDRSQTAGYGQNGYQSRTLDIDILFYDQTIIREPDLTLPHPHLHERAFVLIPLLELAPELMHPVLNQSVRQLTQALGPFENIQPLTPVQ